MTHGLTDWLRDQSHSNIHYLCYLGNLKKQQKILHLSLFTIGYSYIKPSSTSTFFKSGLSAVTFTFNHSSLNESFNFLFCISFAFNRG